MNLTVSWEYQTNRNPQEKTSLSYQIDLRNFLHEWVTIGFSAATGFVGELNNLLSWEFDSTFDENGHKNTQRIRLVLILSGALVVGVGTLVVYALVRRKTKRRKKRK